MTVIVYRDGVMAADSLETCGPTRVCNVEKIWRDLGTGAICGASGNSGTAELFREWVSDGAERATRPDINEDGFEAIVIFPDGRVDFYSGRFIGRQVDAPFLVLGSGFQIALGALEMGATAEQAVAAAIKHRGDCGGPVRTLRHE